MKKTLIALLLLLTLFPAFASKTVWYEVFVPSFYDSNADGTGDLKGLESKVNYLSSTLGVGGIWLMPISPSPSYHKYDVVSYKEIDPSYGTMKDFESLMSACKKAKIDVILDLVLNHCSSQNPWFIQGCQGVEPYKDFFNFSEVQKTDYHAVPGKENLFYEAHFSPDMPDFNLDNEELREELLNICRFWLDKGVAGFRLDAVSWYYGNVNSSNVQFLSWLTSSLQKDYPEVYLVGEAWTDSASIAALYEGGINSLFNFPFSQSSGLLISCVRTSNGQRLQNGLNYWYSLLPSKAIDAPFLSNHDTGRSAGSLITLENQKMAASVYLLLPGRPFIYYGEELGMRGSKTDPDKRTPFWWSLTNKTGLCAPPPGTTEDRRPEQGLDEQMKDKNSLFSFYQAIIALRNDVEELNGSLDTFKVFETGNKSLCAYTMDDKAMVIHNFGNETLSVYLDKSWKIKASLSASNSPSAVLNKNTLTLGPKSTAVLVI